MVVMKKGVEPLGFCFALPLSTFWATRTSTVN